MQVYEEATSLPEYRKWDTNVLQKGVIHDGVLQLSHKMLQFS